LSKLQFNIFEFSNNPFKDGIGVVFYEPEQTISEDFMSTVGKATSRVESDAQTPSVAVQYHTGVCCVPINPALLNKTVSVVERENEFVWSKRETKRIYSTEPDGKEIIRRLVAKAISNQQIARGWFVEAYRHVYYWSFNLAEQLSMRVMDVYPGFIFKPYVYEDGSCAVLVDPKFRFVPRRNYREIVDEMLAQGKTKDEVTSMLEGETVIDACPVIQCQFRKAPSSICRLKGAGRRRQLTELDFSRSPSHALFRNLIEYHMEKRICPNDGTLGKLIKDAPPLALIEAPYMEKPLEFPLERLRKELKLQELDKVGRLFIMKYIQPSMKERWYLTKGFMAYVDDIRIGRLPPLRLIRRFSEAGSEKKFWRNCGIFEVESHLRFAKDKRALEPYIGLETYGPFDYDGKNKRSFSEIFITIFNHSPKIQDENIRNFYGDLVEGYSYRPSFVGLKRLFRVNIPRFTEQVIQSDIPSSGTRLRKQPHIAIIITQLTGEKNVRQYKPFKQELTRRGIPCQFVLDGNIGPKVSTSKYSSYLKNLALCIYSKIGGVPWTLDRSLGYGKCFMGLASVIRRKNTFMSLHVFDHFGQWLGGWTELTNKENYPTILESRLKEGTKLYERLHGGSLKVTVHKDGELWHELEMPAIDYAIDADCKVVCIKKFGFPRMYDIASADYLVNRGAYVQIASDEAMLVTSGPPHEIPGAQKPITINIKKPDPTPELMRETCKEIFELSLVYGGYMLAVTSKPVTTHFASTAASLAAKCEIEENPHLWKKAWFL